MNKLKTYLFFSTVLIVICISCKKDVSTKPDLAHQNYCNLYQNVSTDTNYIPHKKNSSWTYCSGNINYADYSAGVILDTIINNKIIFDRLFHTDSQHAFYSNSVYRIMIDSSGNYYQMTDQSQFSDTLMLIKPSALNGDTIYYNSTTNLKVVLINNNETVEGITNCYHSVVISPSYGPTNYYFKKGIGQLFFGGFKLSSANIK